MTKTEYRYPPTVLTEPTPVPDYMGTTWADVGDYALTVKGALLECNADKQSIIEWAMPEDSE